MKFRTTILSSGKNTTGIEVPPDVVEALGKGKRPPVRVTLNGYTYRSSIAVMGGAYLVGVSAEVRAHAGVAGGDELDVEVELDTEPREVEVPDDFATALKADKAANERFAALSYSHKRRWVMSIEDAKTEATRQRRIAKAVADISAGR
ncbi:YdeI/OmpD-associated family protein [Tenggerimyces flavus]|uniref:YdeI/OmpD-associated family protein n=1 Tax=Tenggerimyces flavus TaxID=1708749 RepID=A0ABV7Y5J9_9ACTN|nr:YdeI/OmpD-associated family protein [Tenggerimyces flavus]MBM7790607.1 hypothetical protein [Tenggerimyces flavus]